MNDIERYEQNMNESITELKPENDLEQAMYRMAYTLGYRDALKGVITRQCNNVVDFTTKEPA